MERIAFSVDEAAHSAGIGLTKLREEIREGRLVARKIGKRTVITTTDLAAWAAQLPKCHAMLGDVEQQGPAAVS
jgi:excisionase family DNA binding protein